MSEKKISRRKFIAGGAAVVVAAGAAAGLYYATRPGPSISPMTTPVASNSTMTTSVPSMTTSSAAQQTITFATWGGAWQTGVVNALAGFEEANNCKINYFIQSDSGETVAKEIAEAAHPTIDIIMTGPSNTLLGMAGGIAAPIDPALVPNLKDIVPGANLIVDNVVYNAGVCFNYMGIAARSDLIDTSKITSWKWMWDPALYPKKLGLPTPEYYGQPTQTSFAWFGDQYHIDDAFQKLKILAPNIGLAYTTDSAASQALAAGDISALQCYNVLAYSMFKAAVPGLQFILPPNESFWLYPNGPMVVKNGPAGNDLQMKLMNWMLSPQAVTAYCTALAVNPSNVNSAMPSDPTLAPFLLTKAQMAAAPAIDFVFLAKNTDAWQSTWDAEIKPLLG